MKNNLMTLKDIPIHDLLFICTYKNNTSLMFDNYYKAVYIKNNQLREYERDITNTLTKNDVNKIVSYGKIRLTEEIEEYEKINNTKLYILNVFYNDVYHCSINPGTYDTLLMYVNKNHVKNIHTNKEPIYNTIYMDIERDGVTYYKNIELTVLNENVENLKKNIYGVKSTI